MDPSASCGLLDERELTPVVWAFAFLQQRLDRLVERWLEGYRQRTGPDRALGGADFRGLLTPRLRGILQALEAVDLPTFRRRTRDLGVRLEDARVPFEELVLLTHVLNECALGVLRESGPTEQLAEAEIAETLGRLAHCEIIRLSEAYVPCCLPTQSAEHASHCREGGPEPQDGLVGSTSVMRALRRRIAAASAGRGTVLIVGETGTGKELIARAVHGATGGGRGPFVAVNCAALPGELVESELFGHRRGSFSGAHESARGLIREAHGGTLFLDEVTEMPAAAQAKLLRVLQERTVRAVGARDEVTVDLRVVASTNRDPLEAIRAGSLRRDLFYRLKVHTLRAPALREHIEDLPDLCRHFLVPLAQRYGRPIDGISPAALDKLAAYSWPGNVRELIGVLESAVALCDGGTLGAGDIALDDFVDAASADEGAATEVATFEQAQRSLLRRALERASGNKSLASRMLGISRKQLYAKLRKYRLSP